MSRRGLTGLVPALFGIMLSLFGVILMALAGSSMAMIALGLGVVLLGIVVSMGSLGGQTSTAAMRTESQTISVQPQRSGSRVVLRQNPLTNVLRGIESEGTSSDVAGSHRQIDPCLQDVMGSDSERLLTGSDYLAPLLGELTASFMRWVQGADVSGGWWPAFERWLRDALDQFLQARRIRCFQVIEPEGRLASLGSGMDNAFWVGTSQPALVTHVIKTGRRYIQDAPGNGKLIESLVGQWSSVAASGEASKILSDAPVWMLPIREKNKTVGLLVVGEFSAERLRDLATLQAVGHLLELYWRHVRQAALLETAQSIDQASGVLNRADLNTMAERVLYDSSNDGEPVVVLVISVEGLRRLDDEVRWFDRDWLIKQIGLVMREKLRSDDLVGRFSDDRFVGVLRRLDISLGHLIAGKLLAAVRAAINEQPAMAEMVQLRCTLMEVQTESLETVLARIFDALQRARQENKDIYVVAPADATAGVI